MVHPHWICEYFIILWQSESFFKLTVIIEIDYFIDQHLAGLNTDIKEKNDKKNADDILDLINRTIS